MKLALLLLMPFAVMAQTPYTVPVACIPGIQKLDYLASEPVVTWNTVGICAKWSCMPTDPTKMVGTLTYCGTWTEFAKVPARIATIKKAVDPLKSASDAGKRFTIVPLTDPSMSGMPR
jgi:hypothetical protein